MSINGRPGRVPQIMKVQAENAQARDTGLARAATR
jgi:hypothetical protein